LPPQATVFYRFHPLHGQTFPIERRSGGSRGLITLQIAPNRTLSVPQWMIEPEAQDIHLRTQALLPPAVLLELVALLDNAWSAGSRLGHPQGADDATAAAMPVTRKV
jgi:hypothetical protein